MNTKGWARELRESSRMFSHAQRALECGGLTPLSASMLQRFNVPKHEDLT